MLSHLVKSFYTHIADFLLLVHWCLRKRNLPQACANPESISQPRILASYDQGEQKGMEEPMGILLGLRGCTRNCGRGGLRDQQAIQTYGVGYGSLFEGCW